MKKFFFLWILCVTIMFAQYNLQSLNPTINFGYIHQVSYLNDTSVVFIAAKTNSVFVYRLNPQNAASTAQVIFSYSQENTYFSSSYLKFIDYNTGFFVLTLTVTGVADAHFLYGTTDGGATWRGATYLGGYTGVDFKNSQEGYSCGPLGNFFKTTNGGSAWSPVANMNLPNRNYTHFAIATGGLMTVATRDTIWANDGNSAEWQHVYISDQPDDEFKKFQAYSANLIGFVTRKGRIGIVSVSPTGVFTVAYIESAINNVTTASFSDSAIGLLSTNSDSFYVFDSAINQSRYFQRGSFSLAMRSLNRILLVAYGDVLKITESGVNNLRELNGVAGTVLEVDFINASVGYTAGGFSPSMKTTNGGKTWTRIFDSMPYYAGAVKCLSENTVILQLSSFSTSGVVLNSFLMRSIDGGATWSQITNPSEFKVQSFQFLDPLNAYASSEEGKLYVTQDGGLNWVEIAAFLSTNISSFYFLNRTTGWISTGQKLFKTTTGGVLWDSISGFSSYLYKLFFLDVNVGFSIFNIGGETYLYKTTDGGVTWVFIPSFRELNYIIVDEFNYYKTNFYNQTYHSSDGGLNWTYIPRSSEEYMTNFDVINKRTLIVSGRYGNYIGRLINSNGNVLSVPSVYAVSGDTVEIPVEVSIPSGRKYQSVQFNLSGYTDNLEFLGTNFTNTLLGGSEWIHSINTTGSMIRFAASAPSPLDESGTIIKLRFKITGTTSGYIPLNLSAVLFNTGLVPTDTVNGWVKLEQVNLGDVDLNGAVQAFDAALVLQYLTLPGGIPLTSLQQRNANVTTDNTISALDASVILRYVTGIVTSLPYGGSGAAAGFAGMSDQVSTPASLVEIPIRLNNGNNLFSFEGTFSFDETLLEFNSIQWQPVVSSFMKESRRIGRKIYFAGAGLEKLNNIQGEVIAKLYFTIKPNPTQTNTQVILEKFRLNENPVVLNAAAAGISIITGVENETGVPVEYALGQNYPNPFNPSTTIKFALPKEGKVVLELYDIMGKKVALLLDENKDAGYHSLQFNTTDMNGLTSGVYFYRIRSGSFTETKKLLLMK